MIQTWKLTKAQAETVRLADETSLDAATRQLTDGWYSTFRTFDSCSRVIGLSAHLKRLPHADASSLRGHLIRLLQPFRPGEARVRLTETRDGEFFISIEPLKLLPREIYEKGVRVETAELYRSDPRAKSTAFISASDTERKHLAKEGIFEALLVKNGRILEGMTSNFFYVIGGVLFTAQRGILLGVTRQMVIRAARSRGVEARFRPLEVSQLARVEEAFITSSSRGIVPVVQINEIKAGKGRVGAVTKMLIRAYEEYVLKHAEAL